VVSAGSYILSAAALTAVVASLAFSAFRLRARLLPTWEGAPARLVDATTALALLIWQAEILGTLNLLYAWTLVASSLLLAGAVAWCFRAQAASPAGGGEGGGREKMESWGDGRGSG